LVEELDRLARTSPDEVARKAEDLAYISPIEDIIEAARNGHMFILVDDEDRENEGDLVIPAQMATPEAINFMAKFGRGLICLSLTRERVRQLGLPPMPRDNKQRQSTAFTVSIEAREGVTTGISAPDRARTISVAIDPSKTADDIVTPGHVFPLEARDGGVLVRAGHTEAAVDIALMAGLNPSGVICEIMNDDGTMARLPELVQFAQFHGLKIGAIADLIAYRRRHDRLVERLMQGEIDSEFGGPFRVLLYRDKVADQEHIALIKGDLGTAEPVLVRMHALNALEDVLGFRRSGDRGGELHRAMRAVGEAGRGVVVVIRERGTNQLSKQLVAELNGRTEEAPHLRDYGVGAQILLDLGVNDMILLTNHPKTVVGLEGYGLRIVDTRPIPDN